MNRWGRFGRAVGGAVLLASVAAAPAAAQGEPERLPRMILDRQEVNPGEAVIATMNGLDGESVTLTVCGNLARRGSQDCANSSSVGDELVRGGPSYTQIVVQSPPVPCPCIVRAIANGTRDFAVAPLTIVGHPVGPVVSSPDDPLVEVTIEPRRVVGGVIATLRSALGGGTRYAVTVTVRNITNERLDDVVVRGAAVNDLTDALSNIPELRPGPIEPGASWSSTEVVELAAPVVGTYRWIATATGAGPGVEAEREVSDVPWLLYALLPILVLDIVVMVARLVVRRSRRRHEIGAELHGRDEAPDHQPLEPVVG